MRVCVYSRSATHSPNTALLSSCITAVFVRTQDYLGSTKRTARLSQQTFKDRVFYGMPRVILFGSEVSIESSLYLQIFSRYALAQLQISAGMRSRSTLGFMKCQPGELALGCRTSEWPCRLLRAIVQRMKIAESTGI